MLVPRISSQARHTSKPFAARENLTVGSLLNFRIMGKPLANGVVSADVPHSGIAVLRELTDLEL
jgi:hypothetical protein